MIDFSRSIIEKREFKSFEFFLKRDDLISDEFSGNKARKLYYFLKNPPKNKDILLSHGSNQSNAMSSFSYLAKELDLEFCYYTDHISSYLLNNPIGNFKEALENGMRIVDKEEFERLKSKQNVLFIPEGGAVREAEYGIKLLADEIIAFAQKSKIKKLDVFLPSGPGTTALYLQKHLPFRVFTTPCVGDSSYLIKQFKELETQDVKYPQILTPAKKYHFGKLYKELYEVYLGLKNETGVEFELLYDTIAWKVIIDNYLYFEKPFLYIHQGGLKGNISMLQRYFRKYEF